MNGAGLDSEVIIFGGGPVGSLAAALLAQGGMDPVLVSPAGSAAPGRALALTLASRRVLGAAGAWNLLPHTEIGRFDRMRVWEEIGTAAIEFQSAEMGLPALAYVVDQALLETALHQVLETGSRVRRIAGGAAALEFHADRVAVRLDNGLELRARLVIGADGVNSPIRGLAGIDYPVHDYGQVAVTCTVRAGLPHAGTARQRFLRRGPLAFLPLAAPGDCAVVWSTAADHAAELMNMDVNDFAGALGEASGGELGRLAVCGTRHAFPLRRAHAERYCRPRCVLAGDAAHCVHPLAGQGANLGILDAACLAEVLLEGRQARRDPGSLRILRRYERWRRAQNAIMSTALDALNSLFLHQDGPLPWMRSTGLQVLNGSGPLKSLIASLATGTLGDLPRAARHAARAPAFGEAAAS